MRDALHRAKARSAEGDVPDGVLAERVRAELGRSASQPATLHVWTSDGRVEIRGSIPAYEVEPLLARIRSVSGVKQVVDHLEVR